jgi:hypothetical protein
LRLNQLINLVLKTIKPLVNMISNTIHFRLRDVVPCYFLTRLVQQDRDTRKLGELLMGDIRKQTHKQRQSAVPDKCKIHGQHFHFLKDLLILLFGSLAVFAEVSFFFIPSIRAQNDFLREPPSGWGAFSPGLPGLALL